VPSTLNTKTLLQLICFFLAIIIILSCTEDEKVRKKITNQNSYYSQNRDLLKSQELLSSGKIEESVEVLNNTILTNTADSIFKNYLLSFANYQWKFSYPDLYKNNLKLEVPQSILFQDSIMVSITEFLNFQYSGLQFLEEVVQENKKLPTVDKKTMSLIYFFLGEYYQTESFEIEKTVSYLEKAEKYFIENEPESFYSQEILSKLIFLQIVQRDISKGLYYAHKFKAIIDENHPKSKELVARSYYYLGFLSIRNEDKVAGISYLNKAIDLISDSQNSYTYQEILKGAISEFSYEGNSEIAYELLTLLEENVSNNGDHCNFEKVRGQLYYETGNHVHNLGEIIDKAYNYVVSNKPYNAKQLGTIIYYCSTINLEMDNYSKALNYEYSYKNSNRSTSLLEFNYDKIYDKKHKTDLYYFMTLEKYAKIIYRRYQKNQEIEDLFMAHKIAMNSLNYINDVIYTLDEDVLLNINIYSSFNYQLAMEVCHLLYEKTKNADLKLDMLKISSMSKNKIYRIDKIVKHPNIQKIKSYKIALAKLNADTSSDSIRLFKEKIKLLSTNVLQSEVFDASQKFSVPDFSQLPNTSVLDFFYSKSGIYISHITDQNFFAYKIENRKPLDSLIDIHNTLLSNPNSDLQRLHTINKELYQKILGWTNLNGNILLRTDGSISRINFQSLVANDKYLIDNHTITNISSIDKTLRAEKKFTKSLMIDAFLFSSRKSIEIANTRLPELPGNIKEAKLFSNYSNSVYSGHNATKKNLFNLLDSNTPILHIGTHSSSSSNDKNDVKLYMKDIQSLDSIYGFDLLNKDINKDIIVLSSCDSKKGKYLIGEGQYDLSRYFLISGAKSVISSQWSLDDFASYNIFSNFYSHLEQTEISLALKRAILSVKNKQKYEHPYYWAGINLSI